MLAYLRKTTRSVTITGGRRSVSSARLSTHDIVSSLASRSASQKPGNRQVPGFSISLDLTGIHSGCRITSARRSRKRDKSHPDSGVPQVQIFGALLSSGVVASIATATRFIVRDVLDY